MSSSVASFLSLPFASLCLNSILSRPFSYGGKTIGRRARLTSPQLQVQWMLPFQKIQLCTSQALIRAFAHPWTVILAREVQCLIGQVWVKCLSLKVGVMSIPPNPVDGEWDSGEVQKEDQFAIIRRKGGREEREREENHRCLLWFFWLFPFTRTVFPIFSISKPHYHTTILTSSL